MSLWQRISVLIVFNVSRCAWMIRNSFALLVLFLLSLQDLHHLHMKFVSDFFSMSTYWWLCFSNVIQIWSFFFPLSPPIRSHQSLSSEKISRSLRNIFICCYFFIPFSVCTNIIFCHCQTVVTIFQYMM